MVWYSHLFQNFPVYCDPHSQRLWHSQWSRNTCFSGTLLLFPWSSRCWQFDLWFLCLFLNQLEHQEVHGSRIAEAWLGEFEHYFTSVWDECQCSCLENPRDRGSWWATIYGVAQSRTRLKWLSSSSSWISEKAREFQKNIYFCFIGYAKAFDYVDHNKLENSEGDGKTRLRDLPLEKPVCRLGSIQKHTEA